MNDPYRVRRIAECSKRVNDALLAERNAAGHWTGELSTSALSTATAVTALQLVDRDRGTTEFATLIERGLQWLADHQNADGGWGDTVKSLSNVSTTMLVRAAYRVANVEARFASSVERTDACLKAFGGQKAIVERYGKDKTFSIPILTQCALAGLVEWRDIQSLPFELAWLPARFYKAVRLPVVSYALPALIAIGQVRFHHQKPRNPLTRWLRQRAVRPTLRVLEKLQPPNGGFLEAAPLTSFVTMSLAGMGLSDHIVAKRGVDFLVQSVRSDGSWPIDTNLATWVTTLSVNALRGRLPVESRAAIREWLHGQQYRDVHPYTQADPGGWAWTDLPGGVPDADDTPGAILALFNLRGGIDEKIPFTEFEPIMVAVNWLTDLQNRDGGWPTFCRGWGTLPFDRSAPDLTAHAIRAIWAFSLLCSKMRFRFLTHNPYEKAIEKGFRYLARRRREDGSWLPLWFGNQFNVNDENPTYGTSRVLAAYRDTGRLQSAEAQRGVAWLLSAQNEDGGWGGAGGIVSSVEETALAAEVLLAAMPEHAATTRAVDWLLDRVEQGGYAETSPVGFYFAKLWYFERLYPQVFTASALNLAHRDAQQRFYGKAFEAPTR